MKLGLLILFFVVCSVEIQAANPVITKLFTADPAAMVYNDTVYLYTGHDEAPAGGNAYVMNNWQVFSSSDMENWSSRGEFFNVSKVSWAKGDAWAGEVEERNGKFYFYFCAEHRTIAGKAIGVAVANSPTGPFSDALGHALITNDQTKAVDSFWDDIDPSVFIDDDGQAYMYWGNSACYFVKLKENMIETTGAIQTVNLPSYTEAPYLHKYKDTYYLSYAYGWPEKIAYATSSSIDGPWTFAKVINDNVNNCGTNHQSIIEFKNQWYFIYHTGDIGDDFRRSVAVEYLYYNSDQSIQEIVQTQNGVANAEITKNCLPVPLSAAFVLNDETQVNSRIVSAKIGDAVKLSASSPEDGSWIWQGPSGLKASTSTIKITTIQKVMGGTYLATFTNACGTSSYTSITLNVSYGLPNITSGSTFSIVPFNSGKVLSVENEATINGSNVVQSADKATKAQRFIVSNVDDVYWKITPENSPERGLDVFNISNDDGANIVIWDYWGGAGQQWELAQIGDGVYNIISRNSGKCLDVNQADNNVIQYTCHESDNQKFSLILDTTSIENKRLELKKAKVKVSTNEVGDLNIQAPGNESIREFQVIDLQGKQVYAFTGGSANFLTASLDVSPGWFLLKVTTNKKEYHQKVMF
ncbi:MAG: family 43 glycosylhydrolase [Prolixibacteraceae bacterium]